LAFAGPANHYRRKMDWLQSIDNAVFHFINGSLSNRWCDPVAPFLSWNSLFLPTVLLLCALLLWTLLVLSEWLDWVALETASIPAKAETNGA
jgi:hypothetical protein